MQLEVKITLIRDVHLHNCSWRGLENKSGYGTENNGELNELNFFLLFIKDSLIRDLFNSEIDIWSLRVWDVCESETDLLCDLCDLEKY